jgi:hypothetical protein
MRLGPRELAGSVQGGRALAAVVLAVVFAVTGCSQPGQRSQSGPTASPASSSSAGGKVSVGSQLGSLLTHAQLPAGWEQATGAIPEQDSGPSLEIVAGPPAGQDTSCETLDSDANALTFVGWWSVSNATLIVKSTAPPGSALFSPQAVLTVGGYQPADYASRTLSTAASLASHCPSFTDSQGDSVTVSTGTVPQISSQSFYLTSTSQTASGPIVAQVLLAEVGNYLIGVDTNTALDGTVSQATVEQLGAWLAKLVPSA